MTIPKKNEDSKNGIRVHIDKKTCWGLFDGACQGAQVHVELESDMYFRWPFCEV